MELSRRDAVAALATLGASGAAAGCSRFLGGGSSDDDRPGSGAGPSEERVRAVTVAVAEVVYPSEVSGIEPFVAEFLDGRLLREDHGGGIRDSVRILDNRADRWYDGSVVGLDPARRDQLLREMGVDAADEDPDGTDAERVRYFLVNDLLLALYASPTGGDLVGIENPQGHPGGTDTYQRGPQ